MGKSKFVIPLQSIQESDIAAVGAKALSLARMNRVGLPVPDAFCVTAAAYREHLLHSGMISKLTAALATLEHAQPGEIRDILRGIGHDIAEIRLSETLTRQIEDYYRALSAEPIAVRSSATAEDLPGHSFAGQYETFLGVASLSECLQSVKRCWASLWTERAFHYRAKNGINHLDVNMAVIVQKLVPADASGVLFTADPITGREDRMIIEGSLGPGEAMVKGTVTPDRFVLSKKRLRLLDRVVSNKTREIVPDLDGGVRERSLPQQRNRRPCLSQATLKRLAKLALRVEKLLGCPQDIEWAVSDDHIFLLQSRPITALPPTQTKSWEHRQVWTDANTAEVAPDVVTPLTWSIMESAVKTMFQPLFRLMGIQLGDNPLFGLVAGRIYFNVNTASGVLRHLPRAFSRGINEAFGGEQGKMFELGKLRLRDEEIPDLRFNPARTLLMVPLSLFRFLSHTPNRGARFLACANKKSSRLRSLNFSSMSEWDLAERVMTAVKDLRTFLRGFLHLVRGLIALPILDKACRKWLGDSNGGLANSLLAATGDLESAQAGHDLWRLAVKAHEVAVVEKVILACLSWQTTREQLAKVQGGEEFLKAWDEFMERHGHRTRGELELFNPRWSETPHYVFGFVRNYIAGMRRSDPLEDYRKRACERERLTEQCRQRLKNPLKRAIFDHLLIDAQRGSAFRENAKSEVMRYWRILRRMFLELGQRFQRCRLLDTPDDVFFLKLEEISRIARGSIDFDIRQTIASRRDEYEKNRAVRPPHVVVGKFDPDNSVPDRSVDVDADVLTGIAVSPGQAQGKARVILRADTNEHVLPGEILVAPFTDPGWTPYFVPAAAVVMDQGGLLSHGSILAREYGIPAVVNVGPATRIIKTGQTIQVDGTRGIVRLLP